MTWNVKKPEQHNCSLGLTIVAGIPVVADMEMIDRAGLLQVQQYIYVLLEKFFLYFLVGYSVILYPAKLFHGYPAVKFPAKLVSETTPIKGIKYPCDQC